jgi:hypothetical protein
MIFKSLIDQIFKSRYLVYEKIEKQKYLVEAAELERQLELVSIVLFTEQNVFFDGGRVEPGLLGHVEHASLNVNFSRSVLDLVENSQKEGSLCTEMGFISYLVVSGIDVLMNISFFLVQIPGIAII